MPLGVVAAHRLDRLNRLVVGSLEGAHVVDGDLRVGRGGQQVLGVDLIQRQRRHRGRKRRRQLARPRQRHRSHPLPADRRSQQRRAVKAGLAKSQQSVHGGDGLRLFFFFFFSSCRIFFAVFLVVTAPPGLLPSSKVFARKESVPCRAAGGSKEQLWDGPLLENRPCKCPRRRRNVRPRSWEEPIRARWRRPLPDVAKEDPTSNLRKGDRKGVGRHDRPIGLLASECGKGS